MNTSGFKKQILHGVQSFPQNGLVSVITPVFNNAPTLKEFHARLKLVLESLGVKYELIFVNDASSDLSLEVIQQIIAEDCGSLFILLPRRSGQQQAILAGLKKSQGNIVVVMDADLQDPPEALTKMLSAFRGSTAAVFAGRRGQYESAARLISSNIFKRLLHFLCGVPVDAGVFVAMKRPLVEYILSIKTRFPFLVTMIGCARMPMISIPVERNIRTCGKSSYSTWKRLLLAIQGILCVFACKRLYNAKESPYYKEMIKGHNLQQKKYFESRTKTTMIPSDSPYIKRHIEELLAFAQIKENECLLEIGSGMGRYTLGLAKRGLKVEALDFSSVLLERLRTYNNGKYPIIFHCEDIMKKTSYLEGRFDVVFGFFTLHHIKDLDVAFTVMASYLKPGGRIVFLEPNAYNLLYYLQILITPGMTWRGDRGVFLMRPSLIFQAMQKASLYDFKLKRFGFFPPFIANMQWGREVEFILERMAILKVALPFQLFMAKKLGKEDIKH